jgi:hypothetical protein
VSSTRFMLVADISLFLLVGWRRDPVAMSDVDGA